MGTHLGGADQLQGSEGPGQNDSPAGVSQAAQHDALDAIAKRPVTCTQQMHTSSVALLADFQQASFQFIIVIFIIVEGVYIEVLSQRSAACSMIQTVPVASIQEESTDVYKDIACSMPKLLLRLSSRETGSCEDVNDETTD